MKEQKVWEDIKKKLTDDEILFLETWIGIQVEELYKALHNKEK